MNRTRISRLYATNLKGRSFSYDLSPINIIVAPNEYGKTAVLDAVILSLMGYKLKPGKKPMKTADAIFRSCGCHGGGATELTVGAVLSDGVGIRRSWTMKRGKITYDGPDKEWIPPLLLDPSGFFAMSGPERRNHVLRQCDLSSWGTGCKSLLEQLAKEQTAGSDGKAAMEEITKQMNELKLATFADEDGSFYDWLDAIVEWLKAKKDQEQKTADIHEQTVKGLTDDKANDGDLTAIQSVQPELNEARERHTAAIQAETAAKSALQIAQAAYTSAKKLADTQVDETVTRKEIELAKIERERLQTIPPPGDRPAQKTMETVRPDSSAARSWWRESQDASDIADNKYRQSVSLVAKLDTELIAAKAKTKCPTCGHDITDQQAGIVDRLTKDLEAAIRVKNDNYGVLKNLRETEVIAKRAFDGQLAAIAAWDAAESELIHANRMALDDWTRRHDRYTGAQSDINEATAEIARLEARIASNAKAHEAWANLPKLEADYVAASAAVQTAHDAIAPIVAAIGTLEAKQRKFIARTQDQRRADQSREALRIANERLGAFKCALKLVSDEKERAAAEAFGSLLAHAKLFTDGNLRAPLEYRDSEIGMTWDGNWIEIGEFSGMQQIFALAGLGVALTQDNDGLRIIMVDELGRLDIDHKMALVERLRFLIGRGVIDQALLADVSAAGYAASDDLQIIRIDNPQ